MGPPPRAPAPLAPSPNRRPCRDEQPQDATRAGPWEQIQQRSNEAETSPHAAAQSTFAPCFQRTPPWSHRRGPRVPPVALRPRHESLPSLCTHTARSAPKSPLDSGARLVPTSRTRARRAAAWRLPGDMRPHQPSRMHAKHPTAPPRQLASLHLGQTTAEPPHCAPPRHFL